MGAVRRAVLAGTIFVAGLIGILGIALLSEYQADAGTVTPLATLDDVVLALHEQGLTVDPTGRLVVLPRLDVAGAEVQVDGATVVVFVFPSVAERVAADQHLRAQSHRFAGLGGTEPGRQRVVTARNVLLLHDIDDDALAASIFRAARDLARAGASA